MGGSIWDTSSMMALLENCIHKHNDIIGQPLQLLRQMIIILWNEIYYQTNSFCSGDVADVVISVESKMNPSIIKVGKDKSIS